MYLGTAMSDSNCLERGTDRLRVATMFEGARMEGDMVAIVISDAMAVAKVVDSSGAMTITAAMSVTLSIAVTRKQWGKVIVWDCPPFRPQNSDPQGKWAGWLAPILFHLPPIWISQMGFI